MPQMYCIVNVKAVLIHDFQYPQCEEIENEKNTDKETQGHSFIKVRSSVVRGIRVPY